jgi:hypothetical protein
MDFFSRHSEKGKGDGVHRWTKTVLKTVAVWVTVIVCWKMMVLVGTVVMTNCERREPNQRLKLLMKKNGNSFCLSYWSSSLTDEATTVDGSLFNRDSWNFVLSGVALVSTLSKYFISLVHLLWKRNKLKGQGGNLIYLLENWWILKVECIVKVFVET